MEPFDCLGADVVMLGEGFPALLADEVRRRRCRTAPAWAVLVSSMTADADGGVGAMGVGAAEISSSSLSEPKVVATGLFPGHRMGTFFPARLCGCIGEH
jgi:hypothetical protein